MEQQQHFSDQSEQINLQFEGQPNLSFQISQSERHIYLENYGNENYSRFHENLSVDLDDLSINTIFESLDFFVESQIESKSNNDINRKHSQQFFFENRIDYNLIEECLELKSQPEIVFIQKNFDALSSNNIEEYSNLEVGKKDKRTKKRKSLIEQSDEQYLPYRDAYISESEERRRMSMKNQRKGKSSQSKAQKCIFILTGYYFSKNFNSFYTKKLKLRLGGQKYKQYKAKNLQLLPPDARKQLIDQIINQDLKQYRMQISKKVKSGIFFESFTEAFFQELVRKVYKIMLESILRKLSLNQEQHSSAYLDKIGQQQLYEIFDQVLEESFSSTQEREKFESRLWKECSLKGSNQDFQ